MTEQQAFTKPDFPNDLLTEPTEELISDRQQFFSFATRRAVRWSNKSL